MSGYGRHRPPSPKSRPIRQKLQFTSSDGEDDLIDDVHNSTGGESGFTEIDSPVPVRRSPAGKRLEGSSSPLNQSGGDDDVELWDEESLGSPTHLQSPGSVSFSNCSPSPRKTSRLYRGSPERPYTQDEGEGSSSPVPDCPDTPPHKTFRKLRLFDTPHTPKVCIGQHETCVYRDIPSVGGLEVKLNQVIHKCCVIPRFTGVTCFHVPARLRSFNSFSLQTCTPDLVSLPPIRNAVFVCWCVCLFVCFARRLTVGASLPEPAVPGQRQHRLFQPEGCPLQECGGFGEVDHRRQQKTADPAGQL